MAAATLHPSPVPTPSATSTSPPASPFPAFPRLPSGQSISRNASSSSSRSTASSSSSLVAAPIRPPPIETRTAATPGTNIQGISRPGSADPEHSSSPTTGKYTSPRLGAGRGIYRNGPRSRQQQQPEAPMIATSPLAGPFHRDRPNTAPTPGMSPSTPKTSRWRTVETERGSPSPSPGPIRVTVSLDNTESGPSSPMPQYPRGRAGMRSIPSSPVGFKEDGPRGKARTLSADRDISRDRERRQSQASAASSSTSGGGGYRKPSLRDFVLGEELGRGSYSTVYAATPASTTHSPGTPRGAPREYAIKIINQAHLIAEKKVKYAMIERDALIRLAQPSSLPHAGSSRGHRRGMSGSSNTGFVKRKSNNSMAGPKRETTPTTPGQPKLSISTEPASVGSIGSNSSISPTIKSSAFAGRRPSRSAEPPEMVPERSEENILDSPVEDLRSTAPSPVREEGDVSLRRYTNETVRPAGTGNDDTPGPSTTLQTPDAASFGNKTRRRRQSLALSERSTKSGRGGHAHPGIIRLHSTFNDMMSLYFVLDLAKNGEMLGYIRKYGSLDLESARYYAALLIDTIEFMHDRGVIHRDLKPENILLDAEMRTKITDFGSAKIVTDNDEAEDNESKKRSFVGSADFVSPEVLRNDPAVAASDIWAFGCILYQLLVGRPPFRGATDYLTFQKILKREMEMPEDIDEEAKSLLYLILNLDPNARPTPGDIKAHPFFADLDFSNIWNIPVVTMHTGITRPVIPSSNPTESDIWAVFDEGSDGEFDEDENDDTIPQAGNSAMLGRQLSTASKNRSSTRFDHRAAAKAVQSVDDPSTVNRSSRLSAGSFEPPRFSWADAPWRRKHRGLSTGSRSARTSSSSSANRTALSGLLETMGIGSSNTGSGSPGTITGSDRPAAVSIVTPQDYGGATRSYSIAGQGNTLEQREPPWASLLLPREKVVFSSIVSARPVASASTSLIPSFFLKASKDEQMSVSGPKIKFEVVFDRAGNDDPASPSGQEPPVTFADVNEKGSRGFIVASSGENVQYVVDSVELRNQWLQAIRSSRG
ncbi:hypothetical protein BD324DRAFT_636704 [Kockovaella imperatae]|uniref:non-specific serine/threonine protein kinase n=1 Tax=Kockovaella imperatae TaxID=4999 RepID=A0A1Y1U9A4_9TREE|nr:hypothetical protein BD324DRAFT_636704 [Kockovaella imperatae]ORX34124.1 hypothetical protein BD324DRAFT_636704 [Kockovaella imperatae]